MWWEQDPATKLAMLYLESLGNPRKFSRIARHAGATMPVLTVHAGRSEAGQHAAASHTASAATPLVTREGAVRAGGAVQPIPAGIPALPPEPVRLALPE